MQINSLHRWDVTLEEAAELQRELHELLVLAAPPDFAPRYCAGADVSNNRNSPRLYAGFVVIDTTDFSTVATATAVVDATFPYVPGYLSFREIPALIEAWKALTVRPDVLVFDGQGTAHPRRMGLACHAGLVFGVPALGCAKSVLVGHYTPLGRERGAMAPLLHYGEIVGMAVRTRDDVSPVYVSPGHRMDLPTAVRLLLQLTPNGRYRLPETTRRAHRLVNELREADEGR